MDSFWTPDACILFFDGNSACDDSRCTRAARAARTAVTATCFQGRSAAYRAVAGSVSLSTRARYRARGLAWPWLWSARLAGTAGSRGGTGGIDVLASGAVVGVDPGNLAHRDDTCIGNRLAHAKNCCGSHRAFVFARGILRIVRIRSAGNVARTGRLPLLPGVRCRLALRSDLISAATDHAMARRIRDDPAAMLQCGVDWGDPDQCRARSHTTRTPFCRPERRW